VRKPKESVDMKAVNAAASYIDKLHNGSQGTINKDKDIILTALCYPSCVSPLSVPRLALTKPSAGLRYAAELVTQAL
jgi:hypothetical protein